MEIKKNNADKKVKVTHYLSSQEYEMLMQLYATTIKQNNKKDKSELICESIRVFFMTEVERLEKLSRQTHKELNEAAEKSQPLAALVPLDVQPARVIPFDEFKKLGEFYERRNILEQEVREIDYLLYQYKKLLA